MTSPKRKRRIRMCQCPHCGQCTPLEPKWRGEDVTFTVCCLCLMVFGNGEVASWLEDRQ